LDLTIDTEREKILRIKQVIAECGMLDDYEFDMPEVAKDEIIDFITANSTKMRELSLRMVLKLADLRKSMPAQWRTVAELTCMRH
jgi:hypothetical protein